MSNTNSTGGAAGGAGGGVYDDDDGAAGVWSGAPLAGGGVSVGAGGVMTTAEIAAAAGVSPSTIGSWVRRYPDMPAPIAARRGARGAALWHADTVQKWADRHWPGKYRIAP